MYSMTASCSRYLTLSPRLKAVLMRDELTSFGIHSVTICMLSWKDRKEKRGRGEINSRLHSLYNIGKTLFVGEREKFCLGPRELTSYLLRISDSWMNWRGLEPTRVMTIRPYCFRISSICREFTKLALQGLYTRSCGIHLLYIYGFLGTRSELSAFGRTVLKLIYLRSSVNRSVKIQFHARDALIPSLTARTLLRIYLYK